MAHIRGKVPTVALRRASIRPSREADFWTLVDASSEVGCWPWLGTIDPSGYGKFRVGKTLYVASRVAYALEHGFTPKDIYVLHSCDNRCCVRPSHLRLGTAADNARDRGERDRHAVGERQSVAVLRAAQVIEIVDSKGKETNKDTAARFGVSVGCVNHIRRGATWRHLFKGAQ